MEISRGEQRQSSGLYIKTASFCCSTFFQGEKGLKILPWDDYHYHLGKLDPAVLFVNPWCVCAAKVTVAVPCVCVCLGGEKEETKTN